MSDLAKKVAGAYRAKALAAERRGRPHVVETNEALAALVEAVAPFAEEQQKMDAVHMGSPRQRYIHLHLTAEHGRALIVALARVAKALGVLDA